ncbi:protein NRT1/ PTR FAMILY 5.5 isoform X4 [Lycium barbarum]|uniref:protein NRT1/ PTR FAMILY 5.5 isoform X4 n=1 Tax=Lycium barbarum TaxID=112863 RepID=UPI00293E637F|nr:protein NRT1/ PTR FAMILY 5.5 isoform X4 [Lycium barbarum]
MPECIGEGQHILFYIALALSALGEAGQAVSFGSFLVEQLGENASRPSINYLHSFAVKPFNVAAVLGFSYISPWSLWFGIAAIFYTVAAFIFSSGCCTYKYVKPADGSQLYNSSNPGNQCLPHTNGLSHWLGFNTPTIYSVDVDGVLDRCMEDQSHRCSCNCQCLPCVAEIEVTKFAIRTFPMSMTYILGGVMASLSYTYFLEQANTMTNKVGHLRVPLVVFQWFQLETIEQFPKLYHKFVSLLRGSEAKPSSPRVGVAVSILLGILCTITAAKVESRRLIVVKSYGLAGETDEKIPMTVFWLLPQYLLLGAVDGMFNKSFGKLLQ